MQQDQKRGQLPEFSSQLAIDISQAEQALILHVQSVVQPSARYGLSKQAKSLICDLQQHALQQHRGVPRAGSGFPQADTAQEFHLALEAALHARRTALLDTVDRNLLSELCSVLHSLYVRRADLNVNHALSTEAAVDVALPQHNANYLLPQTDADAASTEISGSLNSGLASSPPSQSPGSIKSPQGQGGVLDKRATADSAWEPEDLHQQTALDSQAIAALRC